ncbi:MAG: 4-hydroxy-tetrahydrodipicolinate reductase [Hyphomicrobiales bacterium]
MKLVIVGAAGRMGRELTRAVADIDGCEIAGGLEPEGSDFLGQDMGVLAGIGEIGVVVSNEPLSLLARADGVLDFTVPAASVAYAGLAAQARIAHVIGTTGFSGADEEKLSAAARHAVIVKSGNMSLGVNLLAALVKQVAATLDEDFDIEILEMHHRHKIDAPSGTAMLLGEAAAEGRGITLKERGVFTRHGETGARNAGDIGFATLRGGSVVGEHSVIFATTGERIILEHRAQDRAIFSRGAVKAALWAHGKDPGIYSMADVLGIK